MFTTKYEQKNLRPTRFQMFITKHEQNETWPNISYSYN